MKRLVFTIFLLTSILIIVNAQAPYAVRGLCIAAPDAGNVDEFAKFTDNELAQAGINVLILRVDFGYTFQSHPELVNENALTKEDVKKLVAVCKKHDIRLIPQINLFGHQSWATKVGKLLEVYPQFDETPGIKLPEKYEWPNPDGLYCKSYCPLHPEVHSVVFSLVDEICDAFETDAFHAGLDEVFYIAHPDCPRCQGHDPAVLFAGEVTKISTHLKEKNRELWMWGDRLIDGKTTGIGLWEGSYNNTYRAIDMIPKNVVICDWHYERPDATAVLFASKGLNVLTCPWRNTENALAQEKLTRSLIAGATKEMKPRYMGMLQTVWNSPASFMKSYRGQAEPGKEDKSAECFKQLSDAWKK